LLLLSALSVFSSCGLETYSIIEPPKIGRITSGTIEAMDRYFSFQTNGVVAGDVMFQGTTVFYKIYASESVMNTERSSISSANNRYSMEGYNRIIALGYQELGSSKQNYPLIPAGSAATNVVIRLFDEGSYTARIQENDSIPLVSPAWGRPMRRSTGSGTDRGFNFFASDESVREDNPRPVSGEPDVNYSEYQNGTEWFVNAYAVSLGRETSYANLYSQLLYLGFIRIRS
jgi:hypothetical protein